MSMNLFRLLGDLLHSFAHFVLLHRLLHDRNAQGISLKSQELLLVVCFSRYLDLFTTFHSLYNSLLKIFFISAHSVAIYLLKRWEPTRETYRREQDEFGHWNKIVVPSFCVGFVIHFVGSGSSDFNLIELLWTFSIVLESFALLPQILVYRRYRQVENLTGGAYILLMGAYRFLYCINWIYRANYELHYKQHWVVYFFGVVHVVVATWGFFWPTSSTEESAPLGPQIKEFCSSLFTFRNVTTPELEPPPQEYALVEDSGDKRTDTTSKDNEQSACGPENEDFSEDPLSEPLLVV